jgi:hypothetical protein
MLFQVFIILIFVLIGILILKYYSESFTNDYYSEYCPREDSVYVAPPAWWRPGREYNKNDWLVNIPDSPKEMWVH